MQDNSEEPLFSMPRYATHTIGIILVFVAFILYYFDHYISGTVILILAGLVYYLIEILQRFTLLGYTKNLGII